MPSVKRSRSARGRVPLADELSSIGPLKNRTKKRKSIVENEGENYLDTKSSRKILRIAQDLANDEIEAANQQAPVLNTAFDLDSRLIATENDDLGDDEETPEAWEDEEGSDGFPEVDIDPKDLNVFDRFASRVDEHEEGGEETNLADLILEKIAAHETAKGEGTGHIQVHGGGPRENAIEMNPKIIQVYSTIGLLLSRYKSGKLPKAFKILPTVPQWEYLLALTRPDSWTPNACYEATRIFVSSKPHITQPFLQNVILERVREDIHETKRLNVHLYNSLKKALYKPASFFKGFLFPLLSDGTCTLREAHIVSSVLVRVSIPVLHSAAAILRLTEIAAEQTSISTEGSGATNIFIRVLLDKKYALPYKVIDGLVFHFLRFRTTPADQMPDANALGSKDAKLPVLWHQCLLAFAQRYRNDVTEDQREALLDLLLVRGHKEIGPEVRRELLQGRGRGIPVEQTVPDSNDDTMIVDYGP